MLGISRIHQLSNLIFLTVDLYLHIDKVKMLKEMFPCKSLSEINASLNKSIGDIDEAVTGLLAPDETTSSEGITICNLGCSSCHCI